MSPRADAQGRWEVCFAVESDRRKRPGSIETIGGDRRDDYFRNHKLLVIAHHRVSVTGFLFKSYFKQTRKVTFRPVPRFLLSVACAHPQQSAGRTEKNKMRLGLLRVLMG